MCVLCVCVSIYIYIDTHTGSEVVEGWNAYEILDVYLDLSFLDFMRFLCFLDVYLDFGCFYPFILLQEFV